MACATPGTAPRWHHDGMRNTRNRTVPQTGSGQSAALQAIDEPSVVSAPLPHLAITTRAHHGSRLKAQPSACECWQYESWLASIHDPHKPLPSLAIFIVRRAVKAKKETACSQVLCMRETHPPPHTAGASHHSSTPQTCRLPGSQTGPCPACQSSSHIIPPAAGRRKGQIKEVSMGTNGAS
eukprot:scaffold25996_cov20-Tisochrysis_lutea.AAC.3